MENTSNKRFRLPDFCSVDDVIESLQSSRNICVVTGAGISTSCGIPDFRSKDFGLYNTLNCNLYGIPSAELLFDYEYFCIDPKPFYKFASSMIPSLFPMPSLTHHFIAMLESFDKLIRNYTQNVDGIEKVTGITRLVECHGAMDQFKCMKCKRLVCLTTVRNIIERGDVPYCECGGVYKPEITFFGEKLPKNFMKQLKQDCHKCDLIFVIGTSLKVHSILEVLKLARCSTPQILINRDKVCLPSKISEGFDVQLLGTADDVILYLCKSSGYLNDLYNHICTYYSNHIANCNTSNTIWQLDNISLQLEKFRKKMMLFEMTENLPLQVTASATSCVGSKDNSDNPSHNLYSRHYNSISFQNTTGSFSDHKYSTRRNGKKTKVAVAVAEVQPELNSSKDINNKCNVVSYSPVEERVYQFILEPSEAADDSPVLSMRDSSGINTRKKARK